MVPKATVPAAKTAAPAAKKANVGYNVQTAVGRTSDTGIPVVADGADRSVYGGSGNGALAGRTARQER